VNSDNLILIRITLESSLILEFQIILSNNNNIIINKTFNRENIKIKEIIGDKAFLMITKINLKIVKGLIKIGIQGDFN